MQQNTYTRNILYFIEDIKDTSCFFISLRYSWHTQMPYMINKSTWCLGDLRDNLKGEQ